MLQGADCVASSTQSAAFFAFEHRCCSGVCCMTYERSSERERIRRVVRLIMSALIAFLLTGVAVAEEKTPRRLMVPSDEALAIMIKTVLIAYNDANLTGNYTVLRDLASPSFRESNSSASLAEIFKDMRQKKIDIAPIVLFKPKLVQKPRIDDDGDLILEGFFDTRPERVEFFLVYRAAGGLWQLFALRVTTKRVEDAIAVPSAGTPLPQAKPATQESTLEKPKQKTTKGGN
jgi:hypothetical protein